MTTIIKNQIVPNNSALILKTNSNSPYVNFFNILESTEKAIKIQNCDYKEKTGWLPKSSLKFIKQDAGYFEFSFENWFRKVENGKLIDKAFRLF